MHLMADKCRINSKHQNTYFELGRVLSAGPDSEVYENEVARPLI